MAQAPTSAAGRIARNTAIFSILTGLSRIAGLVREVVASSYFGTSGAFSAFTFAFQIPNLVRSLFADAALSAAFVPVFTELLEKGRKREAFQLASTFVAIIVGALTAVTLFFVLLAPYIMPPLTGDDFSQDLDNLMVGLSQVLFPIVLLLGLNGLLVGILNAYDHFSIPALAPLVWNVVIIVLLVVAQAAVRGSQPALRVRDRRAGRDGRAAGDVPAGAAQARLRVRVPGQLPRRARASRCSCSCCRSRSAWA